MDEPRLVATGLRVAIRGKAILHDINAQFRRGQVHVILGENGAGKSTLLAALAGLIHAERGQVTLDGAPLAALKPALRARRIGFLAQRSEIHWNLQVRALIAMGMTKTSRDDPNHAQKVRALLARIQMTEFEERDIFSLSGGEASRVLLARALAGQPEFLLADEPLANLDPRHQWGMAKLFKDCANQGMGVILVLHDINLAARIADQAIILKAGKILTQGPAAEAISPANLQAAFDIPFHPSVDASDHRYFHATESEL